LAGGAVDDERKRNCRCFPYVVSMRVHLKWLKVGAISQRKSEGLGTISLAAVGGRAGRIRAVAEARLREAGFDARIVGQESPVGPEIVFFDAAEESLYDLLRHLSDREGTCLLAVAADPSGF